MNTQKNTAITPSSRLGLASWCLLDWANAAFVTLVGGFIFGPYMTDSVFHNKILGTEVWSWAIAAVGILVALLAPMLGATIDQLHRRKPWMFFFVIVMCISTALLVFTAPSSAWIVWGLVFFIIAGLCFEFIQVIYNTILYCIAPAGKIGRLSGWGWSLGYFGGIIALLIALFVFFKSGWITHQNDWDVRAIMVFVAVWSFVFSLPFFFFTPDEKRSELSVWCAFIQGAASLKDSFSHLWQNRTIFVYLLGHLFYMDGLNTLLAYSAIYCTGVFHMTLPHVLLFAVLVNLSAGIGAIIFAWIDDWLGPKLVICLSLVALIIAVAVMLATFNIVVFWIAGLCGGLFIGPVQASSRSYMARIVPPNLATQLFGMYALSGRVTAFIGPLIVGGLVALFDSQRVGLLGPLVMMLLGVVVMFFLPRVKHRAKVDM